MKQFFFLLVICCCLNVSGQETHQDFDGKKWEAPYFLDTPKGWDIERFLIPIAFAPSINYKGVEDIRFTPGWSKKESNEYWGYTFLWYLETVQQFDAKIIEKYLIAYYTGLANVNVDRSKVDIDKLVTVQASIKKVPNSPQDDQTFEGTVTMLDYMTLKPLSLQIRIHIRYCKAQEKTFVFHEVSPQPYSNKVWEELGSLWATFVCVKK